MAIPDLRGRRLAANRSRGATTVARGNRHPMHPGVNPPSPAAPSLRPPASRVAAGRLAGSWPWSLSPRWRPAAGRWRPRRPVPAPERRGWQRSLRCGVSRRRRLGAARDGPRGPLPGASTPWSDVAGHRAHDDERGARREATPAVAPLEAAARRARERVGRGALLGVGGAAPPPAAPARCSPSDLPARCAAAPRGQLLGEQLAA